jgi:hypothetical protein
MRNMHLEAAIWNLFTSLDFFEEAAREWSLSDFLCGTGS